MRNGSKISMNWKAINQILKKDKKLSWLPNSFKVNEKFFNKPAEFAMH